MAWWIQPLEIVDESGNPTGRFRLTANSDEGGGGPFGDTSHDHASAEEAQECDLCDEYCSRISGFPPRKERQSERADRDAGEAEKRIRGAMTSREAKSGWATVQVPDLSALLAEIDRLTRERDEARAERERFRAALNTIARTPAMPFPDPGAHSARAYHEAVFVAWSRSNQTARAALAQIEQEDNDAAM